MNNFRGSSRPRFITAIVTALVFTLLSACGGSSDAPSTGTPPVSEQPPSTAPATPTLTVFAGNTGGPGVDDGAADVARFSLPSDVAIAGNGTLYIADSFNHTIRKMFNGQVSTLAGTPGLDGHADGQGAAARFYSPVALAVDAAHSVYVADSGNHVIRKISPGGAVTTLAGAVGAFGNADGQGDAARFLRPVGVASAPTGHLYVVDEQSGGVDTFNTLRRITPEGTVTTVTSNDPSFAIHGEGIAMDGSGNLFVIGVVGSDTTQLVLSPGSPASVATIRTPKLLKLSPAGTVTTLGVVPSEGIYTGVAVDPSGNVYFSDRSYHRVYAYSAATGRIDVFAGSPGPTFTGTHGVLIITSPGSADGVGAAAQFNGPRGLAADGSGNLYIADDGNFTLRKSAPQAEVTTIAGAARRQGRSDGAAPAATLGALMNGSTTDGAGNVYVTDSYAHTVRKITPGGLVTTVAGKAGERGSADGAGAAARFFSPAGIVADAAGNLFVADSLNKLVRKIAINGDVTTIAGAVGTFDLVDGVGSNAHFIGPTGITRDSAGNLFVTDGPTIRKITPAGAVSTIAGRQQREGDSSANLDGVGAQATFNKPNAITIDGAGNLYVVDIWSYTVRRISPGGEVVTIAGKQSESGLVDGPGLAARFTYPTGIAIDANGNLFISDSGNTAIRKIARDGTVSTVLALPARQNSWAQDSLQSITFQGTNTLYLTRPGAVLKLDLGTR
jgi:sugar lactone lactonase YvrE